MSRAVNTLGAGGRDTYNPGVYNVASLEEAKRIILTHENGRSTEQRWQIETPYLLELLAASIPLSGDTVVLDYGCGVGRLAKELIARYGCRVIGVDISAEMRALAEHYVGSDRFTVCAPDALDPRGEAFADVVLAVWVLQHCPKLPGDLRRIRRALKPDGRLFVVNEVERCIPTKKGWISDGIDVRKALEKEFPNFTYGRMNPEVMTAPVADRTFWATYAGSISKNLNGNAVAHDKAPQQDPSTDASTGTAGGANAATDTIFALASAPTVGAPAPERRAYPAPAETPTQQGPNGLRFDFNDGCRVLLPETGQPWRVRISDLDTGNILFETELKSGRVNSSKRYFIRFRLEVWQNGENVLTHDYAATNRDILVQFPVGTLGDPLGWFPYAVKFLEKHSCKLTCAMSDKLIALLRDAYPQITFVTHDEVKTESYYATYSLGLFFDDKDNVFQPCDFRHVGLHRTAGYILGVDPTETPPRIALADDRRPMAEPYVCIAVQSTTQSKYWNNPHGWHEIVGFLKQAGYRVVCIDQKPTHGTGLVWNHIPNGAEDETGDRPLQERVRWLKHAEFFIGLSSGLSWLAWAAGIPVVLISGFTHPTNEFDTPYRVINYHACNSCWNDVRIRFDHKDFLWCPRHKDTPRQFECTRLITVDHVKATIARIPGFGVHEATIDDHTPAPKKARGSRT